MLQGLLITLLFLLVIIGNILWFRMKNTLSNNGYRTSLFWHGDDINNFIKLMVQTEDPALKKKYNNNFGQPSWFL